SQLWFNVPLNTKCSAKLTIRPRVCEGFSVIIKEPFSPWLKIARRTGKVPFSTIVTIDTTGLSSGEGFKEYLEFQVDSFTVYKEPIYLTTQIYVPTEETIFQQTFSPLNA